MAKYDIGRLYIMLFATIFAIFLKLASDNFIAIPQIIGFALSPVLALGISQWLFEKKIDGKEIGLFVVFMFLTNILIQLFPNIRDFSLFSLQTGTAIGLVVTVTAYWMTIPLSVAISDAITDKGINIFKRRGRK